MRQELAEMVAQASDGLITSQEALTADAGLAELGLGSLGLLRLADAVEARFGIQVDLSSLDSVASLDAALREAGR